MHEWVLERARERGDEDLALCVVTERGSEPTDEDASVRADGCFRVGLHLGKMPQEFVIENAVV